MFKLLVSAKCTRVFSFSLFLPPLTCTKCMEATMALPRVEEWYLCSLAYSENLARACRHFLLAQLAVLGVVNWCAESEGVLSGDVIDSNMLTACLSDTHIKTTLCSQASGCNFNLLAPLGIGIKCPGTKLSWQLGNHVQWATSIRYLAYALWHINCLKVLSVFLALRPFATLCYNLCIAGGNGLGSLHKN